jgi:hypothetical protein
MASPPTRVEAATPKPQPVLWDAEVMSEQPSVFQEASTSSRLVMQLTKGDIVGVILKISVLGENWCRVELQGRTEAAGYVICGNLRLAPKSSGTNASIRPKGSSSSTASASSQQSPAVHSVVFQKPLTNEDILDLSKAGISPEILVAKIKSSTCVFDTSPAALHSLKAANLGDNLVLAMVEAPLGQTDRTETPSVNPTRAANATVPSNPIPASSIVKDEPRSSVGPVCVILKRMGPADQITSHMYSFGIRGKQFQYVEGQLPKGVTFHGRLTDHDIRIIKDKGGELFILEPKYSVADLEEARKGCQRPN